MSSLCYASNGIRINQCDEMIHNEEENFPFFVFPKKKKNSPHNVDSINSIASINSQYYVLAIVPDC